MTSGLLIALVAGIALIAWAWTYDLLLKPLKIAATAAALILWLGTVVWSSAVYVNDDMVGVVTKKFGGGELPTGRIVAVNGENGPQAKVLGPGWHLWFWPWQYGVTVEGVTTIAEGKLGHIETFDGVPLGEGMIFAPAWENREALLNAETFLQADGASENGPTGYKGPQVTTLKPGTYRYNPRLYKITTGEVTDVAEGHVKVVKANEGALPKRRMITAKEVVEKEVPMPEQEILAAKQKVKELLDAKARAEVEGEKDSEGNPVQPTLTPLKDIRLEKLTKTIFVDVKTQIPDRLVDKGQRGIWREPLYPNQYYLHNKAYKVIDINTLKVAVAYSKEDKVDAKKGGIRQKADVTLNAIVVLSKDGFEFPVDVRVIYHVEPEDAPLVVATIGDDENVLTKIMTPSLRSIFRNGAEDALALEFVKERSKRQRDVRDILARKLISSGITVDEVLIGRVGNKETLGNLLKTQTDRQIAIQQQITFVDQQKAAEKKKSLAKTEEEAIQERELAKAEYAKQIAVQVKQKRITEAEAGQREVEIAADAKAYEVKKQGEAQAAVYIMKVEAIGKNNAALLEALQMVKEGNIKITPNVMVGAGGGSSVDALMGTMLGGFTAGDNK
jgi:uncharacterized membrane protein YqiK